MRVLREIRLNGGCLMQCQVGVGSRALSSNSSLPKGANGYNVTAPTSETLSTSIATSIVTF